MLQYTNIKLYHTQPFNGLFLGLPRSAGTRKVKPIWILLKHETVSGSGISASLQTDNHASTPPLKFFTGRMPFLPPNQQRQSTEGIKLYQTAYNRHRGNRANLLQTYTTSKHLNETRRYTMIVLIEGTPIGMGTNSK